MTLSRRELVHLSLASAAGALVPRASAAQSPAPAGDTPPAIDALRPLTDGVTPITLDEHRKRLARAQALMRGENLDAIVLASGSGLDYFTGAEWGLSERFFGAVITREGDPAWVTPAFEKARALEQIQIGTDVRAWEEHESPSALVASILRERGATGRVGIEEMMPFTFANEIGAALPSARLLSATPVTAGCRVVKDAHELALMRRANEITMAAHRAVFQSLREGMTQSQVRAALGNPDRVTKGVVEWNPPPGPAVALMGVVRVGTPYEDWFYDGGDTHYHVFLGPPGSATGSNKGEWEVLTTPRASPASAAVAGVDVVPPAR